MNKLPSKTFCIYPWVHTQIDMDGSVLTCCEVPLSARLAKVQEQSLEEIWNSKNYKDLRKKFMTGAVPDQCRSCFDKEDAGHESDRVKANEWYSDKLDHVDKMDSEFNLPLSTLKSVDLRVSNICNYKCRTCTPAASSSWASDWKFLSKEKLPSVVRKAFDSPNMLIDFIGSVTGQLEKIYFAGGEPLLQVEHYQLLEKLIEEGHAKGIDLFYNTNLSVTEFGSYQIGKILSQFKSVTINLSVDGVSERGEYLRDGFIWEDFKKNLKWFSSKISNSKFYLNITVSNLNISYLPETIQVCLDELNLNEEDILLNPVTIPKYYALSNVQEELKASIDKELITFSKELKSEKLSASVQAMVNMMSIPSFPNDLKALKQVTKRLDQIRGQSYNKTFPKSSSLIPDS
jgi:radical SAM protein with 4Fe4S-binding SPASM domain